MENQKEDATESDTNVNESNAEDGEEDVEGSEIVDKSAGAQPTSRGREEEDAIMVLEEVLEVVSDGRQEEEEEEEEVEEEEVTPTNTVREEEVHSDLVGERHLSKHKFNIYLNIFCHVTHFEFLKTTAMCSIFHIGK